MKAKKSLGQNFLKSTSVLKKIVNTGSVLPTDLVLEIGPGKGALTRKILDTGARAVAVEKDRELIPILKEEFKKEIKNKKLILIEGDILDLDLKEIGIEKKKYKLVANIPYYITGAIIRKFLSGKTKPEKIVLLVQKEVAERIVARDGRESILSMSVKAYGDPKYIDKVPKRYFSPEPRVDSAILLVDNISSKKLDPKIESVFFDILHAGFGHKRKVLKNNLQKVVSKEIIEDFWEKNHLSPTIRAEELELKHWLLLAKVFNSHKGK